MNGTRQRQSSRLRTVKGSIKQRGFRIVKSKPKTIIFLPRSLLTNFDSDRLQRDQNSSMCSPKILSKMTASRAKDALPSVAPLPFPMIGSSVLQEPSPQRITLHSAIRHNHRRQKLQHNGVVDLLLQEGLRLDQEQMEFRRKLKALQVYSKLQELQGQSLLSKNSTGLKPEVVTMSSFGSTRKQTLDDQPRGMIQSSFTPLPCDRSDRLAMPLHHEASSSPSLKARPSESIIPPLPERFPKRLYRMLMEVEQHGRDHIVSFNQSGTGFQIHDAQRFETEVLPQYFAHGRMGSFKRQLNLYGFRLVTKGKDAGSHAHQVFHRSNRAQSERIRRVK